MELKVPFLKSADVGPPGVGGGVQGVAGPVGASEAPADGVAGSLVTIAGGSEVTGVGVPEVGVGVGVMAGAGVTVFGGGEMGGIVGGQVTAGALLIHVGALVLGAGVWGVGGWGVQVLPPLPGTKGPGPSLALNGVWLPDPLATGESLVV